MDGNNIRQHLEQVVIQLGFKPITEESDKNSHYFELRHRGRLLMSVIRISNHCTGAATWKSKYISNNPTLQLSKKEVRRYRGNYSGLVDKYFQKRFMSIVVFEPEKDGNQQCDNIQEGNISVKQIVYNATRMTNESIAEIDNIITKFANNITENKQYNTNTMNNTKKRIRLTESDLRKLIKESVKTVLNERHNPNSEIMRALSAFNNAYERWCDEFDEEWGDEGIPECYRKHIILVGDYIFRIKSAIEDAEGGAPLPAHYNGIGIGI